MANLKTDYLIIGNSAAGVTAAEQIRAHDEGASITVVSREPYPAYGRPLISYLIEGKTAEEKIWLKPAGFYEDQRIEALLGPEFEVVELDPEPHEARLANGQRVAYGKCLLATGSVPFTPPIKGLAGKGNVCTFITLDDAKAAWDMAEQVTKAAHAQGRESRIMVIGAGLIGLKAAEALSYHADEILVLELAPRILPAVLDAEGAAVLQGLIGEHGITCSPGVSASELLGEGERITGAVLTNGEEVSCDMVVAAVGVRPNSALAVSAGAAQGRGLICDEALQTSLPDVYAAGDVVQVTDVLDGAERPLALWPNAMRQGRLAGLHMAGAAEAEPYRGSFAVNAVDFFEASLLTAGVINPAADAGCEVRVIAEGARYAKFVTRAGRLVGYILLNRPENAGIYTWLIEHEVLLDELDERIFEEAPANLDFSQKTRWERLHKCYPADRDERGWKERA
ncbi:NAD(P)/FAD-dependent oxidoreductase [Adlercreutzia sp. ZJ473]|uniref:NAD(P)/FAD-dependent oxidoreductase n=1 Tax=Adlercreutzia sp. ZJ473 TaxID=2722822 RepID=UPI0015573879|nr:FAD-dependent oxidoreductase [Adlercreutzia sp. ZJ473]